MCAKANSTPGLKEYDITRYGDFNKASNRGDGLSGHELLQNAWLESNGNVIRGRGLSRDNPAIALKENPQHKQISRRQRELRMNKSNLQGVSWQRNVLDNIELMKEVGIPRDRILELAKRTREFAIENNF